MLLSVIEASPTSSLCLSLMSDSPSVNFSSYHTKTTSMYSPTDGQSLDKTSLNSIRTPGVSV